MKKRNENIQAGNHVSLWLGCRSHFVFGAFRKKPRVYEVIKTT